MKILFLSYWGVHEGLSEATVIPHLRILAGFETVDKIVFCSIERNTPADTISLGSRIVHVPLVSEKGNSVFLTKFNDFYYFPREIESLCKRYAIDLIICRSSLAGALGYLVHRRTTIPYVVESFEPHADYMKESGVWSATDPRLWIQRFFEKKIKRTALSLLPVSHHYLEKLKAEGVAPDRMLLLPCCVSLSQFAFDAAARATIRKTYSIAEHVIVGIYVGKFGGIYYNAEAFDLYRKAFDFFGLNFFLIILSGDQEEALRQNIKRSNLPEDRVVLKRVPHHEVPAYLSAADVAFSTIKPAPSRIYCSPIKNGEYWANGLPVLLEPGIGDDADIIKNEGGGVPLDMANPVEAFVRLQGLLKQGRESAAMPIQALAFKYRRMELVEEVYAEILNGTAE